MTEISEQNRTHASRDSIPDGDRRIAAPKLDAPLIDVIAELFPGDSLESRVPLGGAGALRTPPLPALPTGRGDLRSRQPAPRTVRIDTDRPRVTPQDWRGQLVARGLTAPQRKAALETLWRAYRDAGPALRQDQLIDAVREFMGKVDALPAGTRERVLVHAAAFNAASVKDSSDERELRQLASVVLLRDVGTPPR